MAIASAWQIPPHLRRADGPDERHEAAALDRLHVIEVHGRLVLQALVDPQLDLTRRAAPGRRNGRDHHRVEERNDFLAREDDDWPALVRSLEAVHQISPRFTARATPLPLPACELASEARFAAVGLFVGGSDGPGSALPQVQVRGATQHGRSAVAPHLFVGVQPGEELVVHRYLYSFHVGIIQQPIVCDFWWRGSRAVTS